MWNDDDEPRPTRAQVRAMDRADRWEREGKASLGKEWDKDNPRKASVLEGDTGHRCAWKIMVRLREEREAYIRDNLDDYLYSCQDAQDQEDYERSMMGPL